MKSSFFQETMLGLSKRWHRLTDSCRWQCFLHNSLWVGLLPAAAVGFGVVFLIGLAGGEDSMERVLRYSYLGGGLNAFSWMVGIWAAVGPDKPDMDAEQEKPRPRWVRILIVIGSALLALALLGFPEWERWHDGERTLTLTIAALFIKISGIFCVALPVIQQQKKR